MSLDLVYTITPDQLRLPGVHFIPSTKTDTCVLVVHGMSGNILENYWADVLGRTLAGNNIACVYSHNRGYGFINDIRVMDKIKPGNMFESKNIGVVYERFNDCVLDLEAWMATVLNFGYRKIILLGHSLGTNKVVHYLHTNHPECVNGVVLASPPDMVANLKTAHSNWPDLISQAHQLVAAGKGKEIIPFKLWDWHYLSAQTYLDLFTDHGPADNLPILRNPNEFPELASIKVPILALMGEFDDIAVNTLQKDLDILEQKATGCPAFTKAIIPGASHVYDNRESQLAEIVTRWIKSTLS